MPNLATVKELCEEKEYKNNDNSNNWLSEEVNNIKSRVSASVLDILDFQEYDYLSKINEWTTWNGSTASKNKRKKHNARNLWEESKEDNNTSPQNKNMVIKILQKYFIMQELT